MGLQADGILRINACLMHRQNLYLNRPILNKMIVFKQIYQGSDRLLFTTTISSLKNVFIS